ncbi:MAG: hypothetical protein KAT37_05075 [Candidatus Aenigmarchaeota archaeon]|nr:hypothetical protein [Candidatus Aenigmarchaeota archaeon]
MTEVKETSDGIKEIEVKCSCGRKIKVKFLAPVIVEHNSTYEIRGESSVP